MPTWTINEIKKEASLKETSTNVLVNQLLQRYVVFDRYETKLSLLPIPKSLLSDIINNFTEKEIQFFAERAFGFIGSACLLIHKKQDIVSFLQVLKQYVKVAGIVSDHIIKEGIDIIVIQHDMGAKCSEFVKRLLSMLFENFAKKPADFEITDSFVVARVELSDSIRSHLLE
ncbi:MAG: hypothetical protein EPO63_02135 [Candidatus Nitrosotenuis sp.]|nr:MAG: hypothetical protein EPO63_02135 [Candidatus Nitrosotenuis sp.]